MFYGCTPVITRTGPLPEVVGDHGYYVENQDISKLALAIEAAMNSPEKFREIYHNQILHNFPMEKRVSSLYQIIDQLIAYKK